MIDATPLARSQPGDGNAADDAVAPTAPKLSLTDFLDLETLREVQEAFEAVTRLSTAIRDADGKRLTLPSDERQRSASDQLLEQLIADEDVDGGRFAAPILVEGQQLGSITIDETPLAGARAEDAGAGASRAAAIQFLYLLANSIARLCYEEYNARQRADELSVLYKVSNALSGQRDPQRVLDTAAHSVAEAMKVRSVSIRLLKDLPDEPGVKQLVPRAVHNLTEAYLNKGTLRLDESPMFQEAIAGEVVHIEDMANDPRVLYPGDASKEGLVSMLCVGMIFQGKPIGTIQLFSTEKRRFTAFEVNLLRAIAQLLATAIENARLDAQRNESQRMVRQLHLAADVQRRMLPGAMPHRPPFDIAARYVPSMELGGDFYDFINLEDNLGVAIGDVVGKGVAASLLMASVRASLRAYAQDVYDLDEVIARVNTAMCRDTLASEFATLWYGVLNPETLRLTYCNAGHDPPILMRNGKLIPLDVGGMIVGVDGEQHYEKSLIDLQADDMLLLYTDGLPDAMNAEGRKFGRDRIESALLETADKSAAEALNHILWQMRHYTGLRRSFDDTTLVVIKVGRE